MFPYYKKKPSSIFLESTNSLLLPISFFLKYLEFPSIEKSLAWEHSICIFNLIFQITYSIVDTLFGELKWMAQELFMDDETFHLQGIDFNVWTLHPETEINIFRLCCVHYVKSIGSVSSK